MLKWLFGIGFVISLGLAVLCFKESSRMQGIVDAVNGPPLFRASVDFSKAFTNEFSFRQSVQPIYGTMYLALSAEPRPKGWSAPEDSWEEMKGAYGTMRVVSTNNVVVEEREMDWHPYHAGMMGRSETNAVGVQNFFGRLPLGDYRLVLKTTQGVLKLENTKQELVLRYDMIHEGPIARAARFLGIVFAVVACGFAGAWVWVIKRRRGVRG
jgi:hypothetical protein